MSNFVQFPEQNYIDAGNVFTAFDPTKQSFTIDNARALMWFAQLAYEVDNTGEERTSDKIERIRTRWGFDKVTPIRRQAVAFDGIFNTTGIIGERANAVILAFAGTDPGAWETVATDAGAARDDQTDVHKGFQAALAPVAQFVSGAANLSNRTQRPLFIAGHSLGAALGILAASGLSDQAPRAIYGFGTPRPGGAAFQARYNSRFGDVTYRLVHGRDLVARVPMSFLGYRHVGRVLQCPTDTRFAAATFLPGRPNEPDFGLDTLQALLAVVSPARAIHFLGLLPTLRSDEQRLQALKDLLRPPGHGPLGETFRALPPAIREHLQDRYIAALAP
jgi:hypothetical protein